jgi:HD-like signal output (HDOD) protein
VFEYVAGPSLAQLLRDGGAMEPARGARFALDILRALECAHAAGIVHRDLKPANILVGADGIARVVDFGIARATAGAPADGPLAGSPAYMAPEYVGGAPPAPSNDIFAAGLLLHEMLTGERAIDGANPYEILNRVAHEDVPPPSARGAKVDETLDGIVQKALARDPARRHASASAMAEALARWLDPGAGDDTAAAGTLAFILRRMRRKSDFPALSATVTAINQALCAEKEPASRLCEGILRDFALTQKLLRLVNAACYSQFGGSISTISRAVTIIGFNAVRDTALALMLLEHLGDKARVDALKVELGAAYLGGVAAREISRRLPTRQGGEEAFVCAMFRRLGRLVALFYLEEEHAAVVRLAATRGIDEDRAAREVLGLSYPDLGMGIARSWNFPESIVAALRPLDDAPLTTGDFAVQRNLLVAAMGCEISDAAREERVEDRQQHLQAMVKRYGAASGLRETDLAAILESSAAAYARDAAALGLSRGPVAAVLRPRAVDASKAPARPVDAPVAAQSPEERSALLAAGVQDITQVLVGEHRLDDVLRIILETMYRAIGFRRVLLFVRDPRRGGWRCRLGFGDDAAALCDEGFLLPAQTGRDVFHAALRKGADVCIEDVDAERVRAYVPDWFRAKVPAKAMVLLPMAVGANVVALIHADADDPTAVRLSPQDLGLLKTLRNQAILAMRQKT